MKQLCIVKAGIRGWFVQAFCNVIDMALMKIWVIYKLVC